MNAPEKAVGAGVAVPLALAKRLIDVGQRLVRYVRDADNEGENLDGALGWAASAADELEALMAALAVLTALAGAEAENVVVAVDA